MIVTSRPDIPQHKGLALNQRACLAGKESTESESQKEWMDNE